MPSAAKRCCTYPGCTALTTSGRCWKHPRPASSDGKRIRGRELQRIRAEHFRLHPLCVRCEAQGRTTVATELDHVVALVNNGDNSPENFQGLCHRHHLEKSAEDLGRTYRPKMQIGPDGYAIQEP